MISKSLCILLSALILGVNSFSPKPVVAFRQTTALHSIASEVTDEMKVAMKAKDTTTLATIRLIRAAFSNAQIDLRINELTNEQAQNVLRKMAKMRQESIDMFAKGGADDRADAERAELAIIERWLPKLASEDQTREWVKVAIEAAGKDNMGKVMGALMKDHKAELDGKLAQKVVKEELAKL